MLKVIRGWCHDKVIRLIQIRCCSLADPYCTGPDTVPDRTGPDRTGPDTGPDRTGPARTEPNRFTKRIYRIADHTMPYLVTESP